MMQEVEDVPSLCETAVAKAWIGECFNWLWELIGGVGFTSFRCGPATLEENDRSKDIQIQGTRESRHGTPPRMEMQR